MYRLPALLIAVSICFLFIPSIASSGQVDIPPLPAMFESDAIKSQKDDAILFEIDKRAAIILKIRQISGLTLDYEADGYFRITYTTIPEGEYLIVPHMLMVKTIFKGEGKLEIDLRHTINWSPDSFPLLLIEGTGKISFKNIRAKTVADQSRYLTEKNSAFFWRPEEARVTTINFLTPVYWNFSKGTYWPEILGYTFLITVFIFTIAAYFRKTDLSGIVPAISILAIMIYGSHFAIRFIPMVNNGIFLSNSEKIKRFYFRPEFGQLAAAAREIIGPDKNVVFMGEDKDWMAPEALCFNIAPTKCAFYKQGADVYYNVYKLIPMNPKEADVVVSYNSKYEIPPGFTKKFVLNKNTFIAVKK